MFHKPFRVQSNVPCKGTERKKLKQKIASLFPSLSPENLEDLLPQGIPLFVIKLVTFGGVVVTTYHIEGDPLFFDHGASVCPSIYTLWRYPSMMRQVMIANQTLSKLQYGSDLLLSAVVLSEEGGYDLDGFKKGNYCALRVKGTDMIVGVGMCLADFRRYIEANTRLDGFRMLHFQGDLLWELGTTSTPMDTHMRICIKAADEASSSSNVIPVPGTSTGPAKNSDNENKDSSSQHVIKEPSDEVISPLAQYREFRLATIAALTPSTTIPQEDKRAAIAHALEERTRYIRTLPSPQLRADGKNLKENVTAFEGLSKNPEVCLYQEAERILDDVDDEIDEVGVTLPERYQADVSESVYKASQYYNRLGLQVGREDDESSQSSIELELNDLEAEEMDFKVWLKNNDSANVDPGISLPKEYTSKKAELPPSKASPPPQDWTGFLDDDKKPLRFRIKYRTAQKEGTGGEDLATGIDEFGKESEMEWVGLGSNPLDQKVGDMDEIGIAVPKEYASKLARPKEAAGKEPGAATVSSATAKTWYSIPELPGKSTPTSVEDTIDMDELLRECFYSSVNSLAESKTAYLFPLLTSTFYRAHMLEVCPPDLKLDVKKSSFKKLSKFLLAMQEDGIVELGENDKGSEVITRISFKHPLVNGFTPYLLPNSDSVPGSGEAAAASANPSLKISTLYMPSHRLISFFRQLGFTKASILDYQQVRESVLRYVKENQLVDTSNPKHVLPDPTLGVALHLRGAEANKGILRQELINMVIEEMKPAYSITRGSSAPIIKRGKLEPVQLSLVQKTGNKKVTLVDNLEYYGVPAADVAQNLQKMAAASTTVNDVQGKPTARQVQVQGNAVKVIAKLLHESYGIPMTYIEAIDKIKPPKTQKKRKKR